MKISKTKIKSRARKKTNPELNQTIALAIKNSAWNPIARTLSGSTRGQKSVNFDSIERETKPGDTVIVVGKVLSKGDLTKKVRIIALSFSQKAREKAKESKSELVTILEEIQKNPKFEGVKIIN